MKSKIGQNVKGIPFNWTNRKKIEETDDEITIKEKEFNNSILLDRHPYFFTYLYKDTKKKYKKHFEKYNNNCKQIFGIDLQTLIDKDDKTKEEHDFVNTYNKYSPVIDSSCVMNDLCRHIEQIDFNIKKKFKNKTKSNTLELLFDENIEFCDKKYKKIKEIVKKYSDKINFEKNINMLKNNDAETTKSEINLLNNSLLNELFNYVNNEFELLNYIIKLAYKDGSAKAMHLLWSNMANILFKKILESKGYKINVVVSDDLGEINYLGNKYSVVEVTVCE